jgi:hypothetical protein|uniref:Allatostatin A prohormone n=1 Tax=Mastotermes darwiniensis TaxID=13139 RepID=V5IU75_MASDA|nr:allatostatin A prohormone precursor [Mastotermes darwiniensis]
MHLSIPTLGTESATTGTHVAPEEPSPASGGNVGLVPHHIEESSAADNSELDFVKRLYDSGFGKRAYSYVSEYKRLPVYKFGLGKRSKEYGFGLGKRAGADGGRFYSFGLGKREDDDDYVQEEEDENQINGNDELEDSDVDTMDKRERLYSFDLEKRVRPYSFGLGKRSPSSGIQRLYGFGVGKRGRSLYSFGLGKRSDGRLYPFGLEKRPASSGRQSGSRFNFGLLKKSYDTNLEEFEDEMEEEAKRSPQGRRYSFGMGKREVAPSELQAVRNEERVREMDNKEESRNNGTAEGYHHSAERVKRSLHYAFGLGKRAYDLYSSLDGDEDDEVGDEEFTRLVRRPFKFGLGKRIPIYDFGTEKLSER